MTEAVRLDINGSTHDLAPGPDRSLLALLREELGLTGAKPGCFEGACGACTVLLDGRAVKACRVRVSDAIGHAITTIEGLAPQGQLHPVQRAFLEASAMQCGYCTSGMIIATSALLELTPDPDDAAIGAALADHVCRCGTYPRILRAVRRAAELNAAGGVGDATDEAEPSAWLPDLEGRPQRPWDMTAPDERDWFAILPPGLVMVHEPDPATIAGWTTSAGAWIHVGADGLVTAFTGKVDVGQDNRTSLSQRVAEELGVPLDTVGLVMGDTDLCPHDAGTFASRSTPDAGERLRGAAIGTRRLLVELAAERWSVPPEELVAGAGRVREIDGAGRSATYGELVSGLRRVATTPARPDTTGSARTAESIVGASVPRVAATGIVTGARRYPSDMRLPGMRYGKVLRPPSEGATLRSVDLSRVSEPGVLVVREGPFVGVVASTSSAARRAIGEIEAEWDHVAQPSEGNLWSHLREHPSVDDSWGGPFHQESGDPDAALADSRMTLDATYTTAFIAHVPLETHVALATWEGERLTVWVGTQVPFGVREGLAEALEMPESDIRVIVPDTGGGFGGKHGAEAALEAARLARAAGGPVQVRWSRGEEFRAGYLRPAALIDIRSAADPDGTITAWEMRNTNSGTFGLVGPYRIANQRLDYQPAAAPLRQGAYRGLAATANHFARESHMDEVASALEIDPVDLRLAHLEDERLAAVLRAAADRIGWGTDPGRRAGLGIACGVDKGARVATAVEVRVDDDRRLEVRRIVSAFECGTIVNPNGLANQVEGATVMGLGAALFEAIHFEDGTITNGSMSDYRVPRFADVPPIEVVLLDRPDLPSAGAGETPIVAIAPALANAIFAATGVRLRSMPLVPDGIVVG
jgi:nicotinate dehydrogenase subunit B